MTDSDDRMFEVLFSQMVLSLNEAAMTQLGKLINPTTGKPDKQLDQAQGTINLLRMLQRKTKGNLSEREQALINQCLTGLQLNYVYEKERETAAAPPSAPVTDGADTSASQESGDEEAPPPGNRPGQNN